LQAHHGDSSQSSLSADYLAVVSRMADAALLYDHDGNLVHANPAALQHLRALGLHDEDADLSAVDLISGVVQSDQPALRGAMRAALEDHATSSLRLHFRQGGGEVVVAVSLNPLELNKRPFIQVLIRDVTARAGAEQEIARSEMRFRAVFTHSPVGVAVVRQGRFDTVNPMLCRILARSEDELVGMTADEITHPDDLPLNAQVRQRLDQGEIATMYKRYLRPDGAVVWGELVAVRIAVEDDVHTLVHLRDVTGERHANERLQFLAMHDALTGLGNRMLIQDRLAHELARRAEQRTGTAVLFLDLDGFKRVNDALGHAVGDQVLKETARRICDAVRPADSVGRWGGDEFVVVLEGVGDLQSALDVVDRIRSAVARPIAHRSDELFITASIGVAFAAVDELHTGAELLAGADAAMYRGKSTGRNRHSVFDQALRDAAAQRGRIEELLRSAVDDERVVLHYQPLVDLESRQIVGAEALLRLREDDGRLLYPDSFLDIAEDIGAMPAIEHVVLKTATQQAARWNSSGFDLSVSINVCSAQISKINEFETAVGRALALSGLPAQRLVCEVTERALIDTSAPVISVMQRMHDNGLAWAVDDFGSGYSSMTYLLSVPLSEVKIDRRFVAQAGEEPRAAAIVRAVAGMAQELHIRCVAEGIEDEQTHALARRLGATRGQGYLYARPMDADDFEQHLMSWRAQAAPD
jgi:diguanylate cyclase (GGDEF)-like protein/PAS domain S-box-containing protein